MASPRTLRQRLTARTGSRVHSRARNAPTKARGTLARLLGSLRMAVMLLIAIAVVLAWGTIYEARFGTASVQRFIYRAWWFQALLAFLALNLAVAALERFPWKRRHLPFVLAHIGIILILVGGIIGGRFGIDGQLIIPEGQSERTLLLPGNVLVVHDQKTQRHHMVPTQFETQAWVHEPRMTVPLGFGERTVTVSVDHYYPDAQTEEEIQDGGAEENPAIRTMLAHGEQQDNVWLFARDPERFGVGWGEAHVLFLEPEGPEQLKQLMSPPPVTGRFPRGVISIKLPKMRRARELAVPESMGKAMAIEGTPYRITFKDYFPDFAISGQGLSSRSEQPNNPAVSFVLTGPEGTDSYLLFALHPEFQSMHEFQHPIKAEVKYAHDAATATLPPNSIAFIRSSADRLALIMTGERGERQIIDPVITGTSYTHPSLGYQVMVAAQYARAQLIRRVTNRSDEVRAEAVHVIAREENKMAEAWVPLRSRTELPLGKNPLLVEFRPSERELPFSVKLLDFRKIDYPGTEMAAAFESDVELTDASRGIILIRTIKMNHPLSYRGFKLFQSSYVPGTPETTVLSAHKDPGTCLVYVGFITVIAGVLSLFIFRRRPRPSTGAELQG